MIIKKISPILAIVIISIATSCTVFAQNNFIVCGQVDPERDLYYDFEPDLWLFPIPIYPGAPGASGNYSIDIDMNGTNDIKFNFGYHSSAGSESNYMYITCAPGVEVVVGAQYVDSFPDFNYTDTLIFNIFYYTDIPKIFSLNDTISSNFNFSDTLYLCENYYYAYVNVNHGDWLGIDNKYIGIKLIVDDTILFAWLKVGVSHYSTMVLKEFACNKNPYIGIAPNAAAQALELYPNPAKNEVCIKLKGENAGKTATFTLYDLSGKKLLQVGDIPQNVRIALPDFAKGLYVAEIEVEGQRFTRKLQIE
ncbi:MAG TPA: T9SS type A sorting domain-containing protein [Bacteroidales bacterium]|nr:T9SS type A sorting domain-containing protein [Bacteroidales bacterium]